VEYTDPDKYATQRGRYLIRDLELGEKQAKAVGYCERGYSWSAIAKNLDTGTSTVKSYMERAMCLYGFEIAEQKVAVGEDQPDYERVEPTYYRSRQLKDQKKCIKMVDRHQNHVPVEFYNDVRAAAKEDGLWSVIFDDIE